MKKESTALATIEPTYIAALSDQDSDITELVAEFFSDGLREDDLHLIKTPGAGVQVWEMPGDQAAKTFTGVIVGKQEKQTRWPATSTPGVTNRPLCSSDDGRIGVGDPGGSCLTCVYTRWGTGKDGKGYGCSGYTYLYVLFPDDTLPVKIRLSKGSLGNLRKLYRDFLNKRKNSSAFVVQFGLEKDEAKSGEPFSRATFKIVDTLDPETAARGKAYAAVLARAMGKGGPVEEERVVAAPRHDLDTDDLPDSWSPEELRMQQEKAPF